MEDIKLSGDLCYGVGSWLEIDNVSDPLAPFGVGRIALPEQADALALSGSYAYGACESGGLQVVDVSNPASPVSLATIDLSEPGPPTLLGAVGLPPGTVGGYETADVTGRVATLLAAAGNGIRIIPLQCPATADFFPPDGTP